MANILIKNIGYLRVSKKVENLNNQREAIDRFANEEIEYFIDIISGSVKATERKGFKEMMEYIDKEHPQKLYVYEISRLGRSMVETLSILQELEKKVMVIPVSEKEKWLTTTDVSVRNLIMAIFSWVAEREREMLIERTKTGLELKKDELKKNGFFVSKRGLKIEKLGRPEREIDWAEVNKYKEKGVSYSNISRILDIPYPTLIYKKSHDVVLQKKE